MQLLCGQCGQTLQVDDALAGGTFTCPHCGHGIPVPYFAGISADDLGQIGAAAGVPDEAQPASAPPDEGGEGFADMARQSMSKRVRVACGKCGKGMSVGARFAGKRAKCPACGTKILIPYPDSDEERELAAMKSVEREEESEQLEIFEKEDDDSPIDLSAYSPGSGAKAPASPAVPHRRPIRRRPVPKRSPALVVFIVLGLIVLAVAAGIWVNPNLRHRVLAMFRSSGSPSGGWSVPVQHPQNIAPPANAPAVMADPPTLKVNSVSTSLFAVDGYFPAPADQVYARITITLTVPPKGEKMLVASDGPVLSEGERQFSSLGVVAGKSVVPVLSLKQSSFIDPGASQTMTLLFAVPSALAHARLSVRPVEALVDLPPPPKDLPAGAIVGTFVEKPPRNLQPLMRNPVTAALQGAANQTLEVRAGKDGFDVSVPAANVSGSFKALAMGVYQGQLNCQDQTLLCKLRLADDGKLLILYLTEEPFHQMTYQRK